MTMPHYPEQPSQPGAFTNAPQRAPQQFHPIAPPVAPVAPVKTMPILHLVGACLVALGLVLVYFGIQSSISSITSLSRDNSGGVLSLLGGLMSLTGVVLGGVARYLDSKELSQR